MSFCLISFDAQFYSKQKLEGNIVLWIVETYLNLKKIYTIEVEKSPENHLSLSKRKQKWVCLPPVPAKSKNGGEQKICARNLFLNYGKGVLR